MKNKIKNISIITILLLTLSSCGNTGLTLSNEDDIIEIKKIISENYEDDSEVYSLSLSASALKSDISTIYKFKKGTIS